MSLVFSREQLRTILEENIAFLTSDVCRSDLQKLAPNEDKMVKFIEDNQVKVFNKHGIEPSKGFADLRKVSSVLGGDKDIMQLLMFLANKEDVVITEAIMSNSPSSHSTQEIEFTKIMASTQFREMQEQFKQVQTDPQKLQQMLAVMQQQVMRLPPEQRQQVASQMMASFTPQQKLLLQSQLQNQSPPTTSTPTPTTPAPTPTPTVTTIASTTTATSNLGTPSTSQISPQQQLVDQLQQLQQLHQFSQVQPYDFQSPQ